MTERVEERRGKVKRPLQSADGEGKEDTLCMSECVEGSFSGVDWI